MSRPLRNSGHQGTVAWVAMRRTSERDRPSSARPSRERPSPAPFRRPRPTSSTTARSSSGLGGWTAASSVEWSPEGPHARLRLRPHPRESRDRRRPRALPVRRRPPGTDYDLGAPTLLPYSPEAEGGVSLRVVWHSWPDCDGATLGISPRARLSPRAPGRMDAPEPRVGSAPRPGSASASVLGSSPGPPARESGFTAFVDDVELSPSARSSR